MSDVCVCTCGEDHPDEESGEGEPDGPDHEEILRSDRGGERLGDQPTDDGSEDRPGAEDREEALRLTGVGDESRDTP